MHIREPNSDAEIRRCFTVMKELRTHLVEADFVARVRRQMRDGYLIAYLEDEGEIRSVAGFRIRENLAAGKNLYVDDLVSASKHRSKAYGQKLFDWLLERAKSQSCNTLELDSGVQRFAAHRFYLRNRMVISSHHFMLTLLG